MSDKYRNDRAHELMHKLMQTDRMHHSMVDNFISALGIHRSQHMVLVYLAKTKGSPSQKQISDEFDVSPAAVAVTLKKLESGGFIERSTSDGDNRLNEIHLTVKGLDATRRTKNMFDNLDNEMFAEFTDEEYKTMSECFDKMQRGLAKLGADCNKKGCK